jgi:translation initiation factor 1 (eIF-1/SUI1)
MDSTFPEPAGAALAAPIPRQDARRREIIDVGIAMQRYASTVSAVEFLRSQDIGAAMIARVLGEPERRRSS